MGDVLSLNVHVLHLIVIMKQSMKMENAQILLMVIKRSVIDVSCYHVNAQVAKHARGVLLMKLENVLVHTIMVFYVDLVLVFKFINYYYLYYIMITY